MASNHLPPAPSCFQEGETGGGKNMSSVGVSCSGSERAIPIFGTAQVMTIKKKS